MDFFFSMLFDPWLYYIWTLEKPKIDVRLLACFPNQKNKLSIEIENVSNILIELKSVALVLKIKGGRELFYQPLNFTDEQLVQHPVN